MQENSEGSMGSESSMQQEFWVGEWADRAIL